LPWYGLFAGVVALVVSAFRSHIIIRYFGAVLIAAAAIHFFGKFDADKRGLSIAGFGIGALVAFAGLDVASRSGAKLSSILALMVLFTVLSGTLVISGSAKQGQLVGASTACVGALFVAALVFRFIRAEAVLPVFAGLALLLGPIMYGQVFSSLPWISAALFAVAAASISVIGIPALRQMRESPQKIKRMIAFVAPSVGVAIITAGAALMAVKESPPLEY
jgi:hypothetical protein